VVNWEGWVLLSLTTRQLYLGFFLAHALSNTQSSTLLLTPQTDQQPFWAAATKPPQPACVIVQPSVNSTAFSAFSRFHDTEFSHRITVTKYEDRNVKAAR